jgi:hypothetical protein
MTLCLAWKRGHSISFASDSRLVNSESHVVSDNATKIFTINVLISNNSGAMLFSSKYGLCFCGSYLNGSIVADTIREMLSALQLKQEDAVISGETITKIAFEIYKDVSKHLMAIHGQDGLSQILFGGYCPLKKAFVISQFTWSYSKDNTSIDFLINEEKFESTLICIGDRNAVERAIELAKNIEFDGSYKNGYTEYHVLRDIIVDNEVKGVGGAIQTGHFLNADFSSFGMVDYEIVEIPQSQGEMVSSIYTFRGIPLSGAIEAVDGVALSTKKVSMAPFVEKEAQLWAEVQKRNSR